MKKLSLSQKLIIYLMSIAIIVSLIVPFKDQIIHLFWRNRSHLEITLQSRNNLSVDSVLVILRTAEGEVIDSSSTDKAGRVSFSDLVKGRYNYYVHYGDTIFVFSANISGVRNTIDFDSVYLIQQINKRKILSIDSSIGYHSQHSVDGIAFQKKGLGNPNHSETTVNRKSDANKLTTTVARTPAVNENLHQSHLPEKQLASIKNSLQNHANNNIPNNTHNSGLPTKKTLQDSISSIQPNIFPLKNTFDSPHEKPVFKEVERKSVKKTDTIKPKVIPPFRPKIALKTKLNQLVMSTGRDVPEIHIDSTFRYSSSYRARNFGGVYFWTDCLDCDWRVSINDWDKGRQGVLVSLKKPGGNLLDSTLYFELEMNIEYKLYIWDKEYDNHYETGYWSLYVKPGQTKIIYIGKKLPERK